MNNGIMFFFLMKKMDPAWPGWLCLYWDDLRKENLIFSKRQFGDGSVITLAGFSSRVGTLVAFTSHRINSIIYQRTLEENLVPYFNKLTTENIIFQQDNATYHVSASTRRWFADNHQPSSASMQISNGKSLGNIGKRCLRKRKAV